MASASERSQLFYWQLPHIPDHWPLLVMGEPLHVYFDDSGCNEKLGEPEFLWAGYLANVKFWQVFGNAWNDILDAPPRLDYWHQASARAKQREAPFDALSDSQLIERESALCSLIERNRAGVAPIAIKVSNADIRKHVKGKIKFARPLTELETELYGPPKRMESAHLIALFFATKMCDELQSELTEDERLPLSIHCEDRQGDPYQAYMQKIWKELAGKMPNKFGVLSFPVGKRRDAPQLQVSDMLAWHIGRRIKCPTAPDDQMWRPLGGHDVPIVEIPTRELIRHVEIWNRFNPDSEGPPAV